MRLWKDKYWFSELYDRIYNSVYQIDHFISDISAILVSFSRCWYKCPLTCWGVTTGVNLTRNCSKLRKIHSGQRPISLTIIPSEINHFLQFVFLWFKFSRWQLICWDQLIQIWSTNRYNFCIWHTRPMLSRHAQNLFWWPENELRQNGISITLEMWMKIIWWNGPHDIQATKSEESRLTA